ncbi:3336_t:CDS:2 [Ambispora gerdemannii]|uniref:3336_t:CDS:1 n=1 Tax=Ambispora gerdemannii TaxID=144530 RepID=A0A9N9FUU4_9GLOM|nr:3336_t:CDS:2 [Ambispora gerdemannii]
MILKKLFTVSRAIGLPILATDLDISIGHATKTLIRTELFNGTVEVGFEKY